MVSGLFVTTLSLLSVVLYGLVLCCLFLVLFAECLFLVCLCGLGMIIGLIVRAGRCLIVVYYFGAYELVFCCDWLLVFGLLAVLCCLLPIALLVWVILFVFDEFC